MTLYVDFELQPDRDLEVGEGGSFKSLTNYPAAVQDVALELDEELADLVGTAVRKNDIVRIRSLIRDELSSHEFVDDVYSVQILDIRDDGRTVELSIAIDQNEDLQFTARFSN